MSEGANWSVRCGNGHDIERERPDTPIEDRSSCPECGTMARMIAVRTSDILSIGVEENHQVVRHETIKLQTQVHPPSVGQDPASGALLDRAAAPHNDITLRWYEPSDPGGSWTIQAIDSAGETIGMAENADWQDAALAILEQLEPRRGEM